MSRALPSLLVLLLLIPGSSCEKPGQESSSGESYTASRESQASPGAAERTYRGVVEETMNAGKYTYVLVNTGQEQIWAAAPRFEVAVGDHVTVPPSMPMRDYESPTLHRTFDLVYFASAITVEGRSPAGPAGMEAASPGGHPEIAPGADLDLSGITPPEGGLTVSAVHEQSRALVGKQVALRGRVVKVNNNILGRNWIHVRDGSAEGEAGDITVTTSAEVQVGDLVLVRGTVAVDKDFGAGYVYPVIVEDAEVTVE